MLLSLLLKKFNFLFPLTTYSMLSQILKSFGLNPKEMKTFEKVRDLGTQPASNIARVMDMPRNTVRFILDGLVQKGLLVKTNRVNTQYYAVDSTKNIIRRLKVQKVKMADKIDSQVNMIEKFGSELNPAYQHASRRPKITFYEGTDGLERVYEHTLSAKEDIKSWASFEGMHEAMPEYFNTYYARRTKKKIKIFSIHPDCDFARERQKNDKKELRESALVPASKFQWIPEIQVYADFINIASWKEKLGIIIESPEISQAMKTIFDMAFETAEKYDKKKK